MSGQSPQGGQQKPAPVVLTNDDVLRLGWVLLTVVALPLVVAWGLVSLVGLRVATRRWYWARSPLLVGVAAVAGLGGLAVLVARYVALYGWVRAGGPADLFAGGLVGVGVLWERIWAPIAPWLVAELVAGVALVPAAWVLRRRRTARIVWQRQMPNVVEQEQAERARAVAADLWAAARIGVRVDPESGEILRGRRAPRVSAPHPVGPTRARRWAFGIVARPTVRALTERWVDTRRVPKWIADGWAVLPEHAGAVRALVLAESGSGKTVLQSNLIGCAVSAGWPVVMIDAKGAPGDARTLAGQVRAAGASASTPRVWNMFAGTAAQISSKVMRVLPPADGANQHYLDEARLILDAVQRRSPASSTVDLLHRIASPAAWVDDAATLAKMTKTDRAGVSMADRVGASLTAALLPLEPHLSPDGWSYDHRPADVTIVSLSPADAAQALIGDLMLADLRRFMDDRLAAEDSTPVLVIVDEFAQLVTDGSDPAGTAASLFETARSAGLGLVLAAQSVAGLSRDAAYRERVMGSGAAVVLGRSKTPEEAVKMAGTAMRLEAAGSAEGTELRSGRAQHAWVVSPDEVRKAHDGAFWLIQGGSVAPFRALPPPMVTDVPMPAQADPLVTPAADVRQDTDHPAAAPELSGAQTSATPAPPPPPSAGEPAVPIRRGFTIPRAGK